MPTRRETLGVLLLPVLPGACAPQVARSVVVPPPGRSPDDLARDEDYWAAVASAFTVDRSAIGPVSRKKRAPKEYPVEPELAEILRAHRQRMLREQAKGLEAGWMFPSTRGTLRTPNSLDRAWENSLEHAEITKRFTVHGLRYTFTHYSTVGLDEKRAAIAGVIRLVPPEPRPGGGSRGGSEFTPTPEAG
ncbi:MAG: phage integrase family protein [Deltaproteobacteria bacterium]|nr:MAG: phage integrase family protein [Deltaproteobacteria bacterium]